MVILIALVGLVTDVIADSRNRSLMCKAEKGINKATADAVQVLYSPTWDFPQYSIVLWQVYISMREMAGTM